MAGDINTLVGARVYIGTEGFVPSPDNDPSAYEADSWIEVGGVETLPEYGDSANEVEQILIADRRVRKAKGARNAGGGDLVCANIAADAGHIRMKEAVESNLNYPIKIVYDDKLTALGSGSTDYFRALIMSARRNGGGADDPDRITFMMGINTEITTSPAT
jgi:hypothetical protein